MKDPAQSKTIYQGLSSNKNNVYIKDPVQPNQTVYISWTQLSQQKCIIYQGPSPNLQEEIDEFFKNIFHRKKIFFTIENFQKKDLLGKKKTFLMKKRPIFGNILKKVC